MRKLPTQCPKALCLGVIKTSKFNPLTADASGDSDDDTLEAMGSNPYAVSDWFAGGEEAFLDQIDAELGNTELDADWNPLDPPTEIEAPKIDESTDVEDEDENYDDDHDEVWDEFYYEKLDEQIAATAYSDFDECFFVPAGPCGDYDDDASVLKLTNVSSPKWKKEPPSKDQKCWKKYAPKQWARHHAPSVRPEPLPVMVTDIAPDAPMVVHADSNYVDLDEAMLSLLAEDFGWRFAERIEQLMHARIIVYNYFFRDVNHHWVLWMLDDLDLIARLDALRAEEAAALAKDAELEDMDVTSADFTDIDETTLNDVTESTSRRAKARARLEQSWKTKAPKQWAVHFAKSVKHLPSLSV